jgi:hypothetical protein
VLKIEFLGDGLEPTTVLEVIYAHSDQTGMGLTGPDGECAYCHGDPCAESEIPTLPGPCPECGGGYIQPFLNGKDQYVPHEDNCTTLPRIHRYMRQSWAETCPVCMGRPS